jgi:hypothetical protein
VAGLWALAALAAGVAWGVRLLLPPLRPELAAVVVLGTYGAVYLGATAAAGIPEARAFAAQVARRVRR